MIANYFEEQFVSAIGWTVLHSLWQVALIALLMSVVLFLIDDRKAKTRYTISLTAMSLALISSAVTFLYFYSQEGGVETLTAMVDIVPFMAEANDYSVGYLDSIRLYFKEHLSLITSVWVCGVLFFVFRLIGGYVYLQHLTRSHQGVHEVLTYSLNKLKKTLNIKKEISIFQSAKVSAPMVIGYVKPCILFPLGVVNQLDVQEVEAVIIHELAHIQRHDFLINILQSIGEIVFYYHPAAWWISANIKAERENCCDDLAIKHCGDSMAYAKVLVKLQELKFDRVPGLALGFSRNKKSLVHRVRRILDQPKIVSNMREKLLATVLFFTVALAFASDKHTNYEEIKAPTPLEKVISPLIVENEMIPLKINQDTFPSKDKSTVKISKSTEDERIDIISEDGEIKSFKVNGREIPTEDYHKYDEHLKYLNPIRDKNSIRFFGSNSYGKPMNIFADSIELWYKDGNIDSVLARGLKEVERLNFDSEHGPFPFNMKSFGLSFDSIMKGLTIEGFDQRLFELEDFDHDIFKGKIDMESLIDDEKMKNFLRKIEEGHESMTFDFDNNEDVFGFEHNDIFKGHKPADKIGRELNRDGLLEIGKENKIELSGKHLKINGDKQAKNIWLKYKKMYEESTGVELTKSSKMELKIEGKKSKRLFKSI